MTDVLGLNQLYVGIGVGFSLVMVSYFVSIPIRWFFTWIKNM